MAELPRQSNGDVAVGQVWRHKREWHRKVEVTGLSAPWSDEPERDDIFVYVNRNTSRRRQPMRASTLRRDYRLVIVDARVVRDHDAEQDRRAWEAGRWDA